MTTARSSTDNYAGRAELLSPMGRKVEGLIKDVLAAKSVEVHSITHRIKSQNSAEAKLARNPVKYTGYADLHDFLGLRVITLLASDVDTVVACLRPEFDIDETRSFDRQSQLDPDRFGYRSFHLVARLNNSRESLPEWAAYKGVDFEIQIRSVLQHSWAEIEHDLGYKSSGTVPATVRRRFARLAGLLELADAEFDAVSKQIEEHQREVKAVVAEGKSVAVDRDSVLELITTNDLVRRADKVIATNTGAELLETAADSYADARASELIEFGYTTTRDIENAFRSISEPLIAFASAWLRIPSSDLDIIPSSLRDPDMDENGRYTRLSPGISLFYLYLHEALESETASDHLRSVSGLDHREGFEELERIHREFFPI